MKFVVDECVGKKVVLWMKSQGYDVISIQEQFKGFPDEEVLKIALLSQRVLITSDKDFGDMIFRDKKDFFGLILLRIADDDVKLKIMTLGNLLLENTNFEGVFVLATGKTVRIIRIKNDKI
jgi:predicted nuclease of predicted toxin-antitoxin system